MTTITGRSRLAIDNAASITTRAGNAAGGADFLKAIAIGVLIALPMLGVGGARVYTEWSEKEHAKAVAAERRESHKKLLAASPGPMLDAQHAAHGRDLFVEVCSACHKADGTGVPGLGKDLTTSWFVASLNDAELVKFVETGRAANDPENTTKVPMLPKGGRADLTSDDVRSVVTYVRGLQDVRRLPKLPDPKPIAAAPLTADDKAKFLAAAGGDAEQADYIAQGAKVYSSTCIACHGKGGTGIQGNGKPLATSEFVKSMNDDALLAFIKKGRDPGDPKNTTGVGMPARGGNPALQDDDLLDAIAYVRYLQKTTKP